MCPGSFDPITHGHLDVINRAATLFGEVIVAVGRNSAKKYLFDTDERVELARAAVADIPGVQVEVLSGLLVDFCREVGAGAVVRGLRSQLDLAYEEPMARMNRHLADIDTVFLLTDQNLAHISSSLVREVHALGGEVDDMLPPAAVAALADVS